jgi:hypothetical protein
MRRHIKHPKFRIKVFPKFAELVSKFGYRNLPMRKTKSWAGPNAEPSLATSSTAQRSRTTSPMTPTTGSAASTTTCYVQVELRGARWVWDGLPHVRAAQGDA